jgi:predicted anti-sigma-YlaC factor YlaD
LGCKGINDLMQRDLQGKLNLDEKELLMGHLQFCEQCDAEYRQLKQYKHLSRLKRLKQLQLFLVLIMDAALLKTF